MLLALVLEGNKLLNNNADLNITAGLGLGLCAVRTVIHRWLLALRLGHGLSSE